MPVIPAMPAPSGLVDPDAIYDAVFTPANPADTFEVLNGGLEKANADFTNGKLPTYAVQIGSFIRGYYWGFDDWNFQYARQYCQDSTSGSGDESLRIIHAGLSCTFVIPWGGGANAVWFGYQAFLRHDATEWYNDSQDPAPQREYWSLQIRYDGFVFQGMAARGPFGRSVNTGPTVAIPGVGHHETRWRWTAPTMLATKASHPTRTTKGLHNIRVSVWPNVYEPDIEKAKLLVPTGGIWVLAMR